MKTPLLSSIGKSIKILSIPLLSILFYTLLPSTDPSVLADKARTERIERIIERIDKGEFYYSGGRRIPLIRHKNLFAIKFKEKAKELGGVTRSLSSVLERNKGLKLSRKSKFFERHKIHLLESCDEGNGEMHNGVFSCLRDDPDVEHVQPVFITGTGEPLVMSEHFVAKFAGNISKKEIDEINAKNAVEIVKSIDVDTNVYVLKVTGLTNRTTLDVANKYYQMDKVEWSHPDWIRRMELRHIPNDPLFPNQWHLNNTGAGGGVADADIDAPEAWDLTKGDEEIIIAIIDEGIDTNHEDFAGKVLTGRDVVNDTDDPNPQSADENHGTAVSGLATANQDNDKGVSGVAPNCKLLPIRLLDFGATVSDEAEAFLFAANNGADIISNSWGPPDGFGTFDPMPDVTKAAIDYAADNGRDGKGCVIFWAAGNGDESVNNDGYASYEKVIAVGASTDGDERAWYSDFGTALDIMSPSSGGSTGITTTDRMGSVGYSNGNYTSGFGGTSAATPIAAGVAALMLSVNDTLSRSDVQEIMQYTADKINPVDANYDISGFSEKYGYGRVNAYNAALEAINPNFPPTVTIQLPSSENVIIKVGEAVILAGDAVDRESAIVSYHWDLDGGATDAFVEDPGSITFNASGTFNVIFTVTDNGGKQASDSVQIMVIETDEEVINYSVDSTDTPIAIPDEQPVGISSSILADIGRTVVEVNVSVNITHPYIGDLIVLIESPNGTTVNLHNRSSGASDDIVTTYDTLTAPAESLNAFVGENPQGIWTLHVSDKAALDEGTLNGWQLEIVAIDTGSLKPDLVVKRVRVRRPIRNRKVVVKTVIKNLGIADSDAFEVAFLLSNDKELDAEDIILHSIEIDGLESREKLRLRNRLDIPESISEGRYYLIVEVDAPNLIRESQETNNSRTVRRSIRIR